MSGRESYIGQDADGKAIWVPTGSPEHLDYLAGINRQGNGGPLVFSDEGVFMSPIDGKMYSGKAGMREHNARHDVINNRDLVGLQTGINPTGKVAPTTSTRERQEIRRTIAEVARARGYLEGQ